MNLHYYIKTTVFCCLLTTAQLHAQSIKGKITDNNNEPLTGSVLELRQLPDSSLVKAAVADAGGNYIFDHIKSGDYFLKASFLGFENYKSAAFHTTETAVKELPVIQLKASSTTLKQAEITGIKPLVEVKADKTVFNVENSINSTGSTAFEVLKKAPGVVVDNNDNIMLKGRGGVLVQIDGRSVHMSETELADYLKSIQSTDVESIELISNPSSKYDAEGTAGIINIKLKKNKNYGTNGSITAGYAIGKYSKYNTALSLNNRNRKFNFYSTYSNNIGKRYNEFNLYREQQPYIYNQSSLSTNDGTSHNYKAGADCNLNAKNTIGVILGGSYSDYSGTKENQNHISNFFNGNEDSVLISNQTVTSINNNFNANLNHHFADTSGHDLTTDFDFGYYHGSRNSYLPNVYMTPDEQTQLSSAYYSSKAPVSIQIYSLKSDYSQKLWNGKLGLGYKVAMVHTDNTFNFFNIEGPVYTLDTTRSSRFKYLENVNAVYLNYQHTYNKLDVQAGVRVENTNSEGDLIADTQNQNKNVKRSYTDVFPSMGLTYTVNKNNSLSLIYSSRIDRPNYRELNPFEYKLDELSYSKGNPFLKPQYSDKIELSHSFKYMITTSAAYSHTRDYFAQITDTIPGGKSFLMPRNLATEDVLSLDITASLQPMKWLSVYINTGVYDQRYKADFGENKTINTDFIAYNLYGQLTFKLPASFSFEISGWYNSGDVWGGAFKNDGQGSLDLGLQKRFLNDRINVKLAYTDIFHTAPWKAYNTYAGIVTRAWGEWESQQFRASLTWRFGNKQMKSIKQRSTGSEQEQKRIGGDN